MALKKVKVGVVGCGMISNAYFNGMKQLDIIEVAACADLNLDAAKAKAEEHGVAKACTVDELMADPEIEIVLNLTVPKAHAPVCLKAIAAGKHVHVEKPFAVTREDGKKVLDAAKKKKVLTGCAPDTFLGGGIQTCRKLVDDGWIGQPVGASAFMLGHGPENWHVNPGFYFQVGGGPLFDMGPYYLTALINLMGPIVSVTASAGTSFKERLITAREKPLYGTRLPVETPTHIVSALNFASGAIGNMVMSFDVWGSNLPRIEIYGTEGSLSVPDPNTFGGKVMVKRGLGEWSEVPYSHCYTENMRGIGVADMAYAIRSGRENRSSGKLGYHVLDTMHSILDASEKKAWVKVESTCEKPAAFPLGLNPGQLDD